MSNQVKLYKLQLIDCFIDRLNNENDEMPEKKELTKLEEKLDKLNRLIEKEVNELDKFQHNQKRMESELDLLTEKIKKEEKSLYGGIVSNPKELKSLQDEIVVLNRKRDELETILLELLDKVESLSNDVDRLETGKADFDKRTSAIRDQIGVSSSKIEEAVKIEEGKRAAIIVEIPDEMLRLYKRLRQEKSGVAVAKLSETTCMGCHLELPAQELDKMTGIDDIWRCPHCRRILVKIES